MKYSRFNILSGIRDSENYFIVNLLSGNADILTPAEALKAEAIRAGDLKGEDEFLKEFADKGYLADPSEELKSYRLKYLDFIDSRESDEIQVFFVTNYSCNFACSYCYQDQYQNPGSVLTKEVIDSFFAYLGSEFSGRRKYITVFGGEPLLRGRKQQELIAFLISKANLAGLELSFVTNGFHLADYSGILSEGKIREVQVTLDGTKDVHNRRRFLKGGDGTFDRIVEGIDMMLGMGITVNLRMVADKDNIHDLPALAAFAADKGWTGNPIFKTQIGRNYELHHCQSAPDRLFDRVSLYESIYYLVKQHPQIDDFYKPAYSVSKFLSENGELPDPLFDSCPACKTEWAFDYTGKIYSCTATVGKSDEALGTFYPVVNLNRERAGEWERRDVASIAECRECNLQLACGGGCGSVALNRTGRICSPDCRPVRELLELGFAAYVEKDQIL